MDNDQAERRDGSSNGALEPEGKEKERETKQKEGTGTPGTQKSGRNSRTSTMVQLAQVIHENSSDAAMVFLTFPKRFEGIRYVFDIS